MCELLNTYLLIQYDYFTKMSENYLKRKGQTYNLWLHEMSLEDSHCDELALLALAQMCNYHVMMDAKAMNWTMLNIPSEGNTLAELLAKCDLHLVLCKAVCTSIHFQLSRGNLLQFIYGALSLHNPACHLQVHHSLQHLGGITKRYAVMNQTKPNTIYYKRFTIFISRIIFTLHLHIPTTQLLH